MPGEAAGFEDMLQIGDAVPVGGELDDGHGAVMDLRVDGERDLGQRFEQSLEASRVDPDGDGEQLAFVSR